MDFSSLILKATDFIEISRDGWIPVIEMKCKEETVIERFTEKML